MLTKRNYMGKDLFGDKFGRFYEFPKELALKGHDVVVCSMSYRYSPVSEISPIELDRIHWYLHSIGENWGTGIFKWLSTISRKIIEFSPNVIFTCSDALHVILGCKLARKFNIPVVVDLYDNFESFGMTKLPGVSRAYRHSVKGADGVVCVSDPLRDYVIKTCQPTGKVDVIENAVVSDVFFPRNRDECRQYFKLPPEQKLVCSIGGLHSNRGFNMLLDAVAILRQEINNLEIVIAGQKHRSINIRDKDWVHDFGNLPHQEIPKLLSAVDLAMVCNKDSSFGRYCFPQKAQEIIANRTPILAANIGVMSGVLRDFPQCLYDPDNVHSLVSAIRSQLVHKVSADIEVMTWEQQATKLNNFIKGIL